VKPPQLEALKRIALEGGSPGPVALTSKELGTLLGVSQQAASQRLLELLEQGLIARDPGGRQGRVRITAKGMEALRREFADYQRIFVDAGTVVMHGTVTAGLGEGAFYMQQEGYREQFRGKLGFDPFAGTLNLRIEGAELTRLELLRASEGIAIREFKAGGRTFGGAKCFPATLQKVACAVIVPLRTHHTDILEVIAPVVRRDRLGLKDGNTVELVIERAWPGMPAASL